MRSPPPRSPFAKTIAALKETVGYDLMLLKARSYLTESEQHAIAFVLAVLVLGIVRKYFM